ncbi:MAG: hypothetical protein K2W85_13245 [Phycisphaerales bacterium]|nr:hypothetical protein [Phycisphaerales bacterium]
MLSNVHRARLGLVAAALALSAAGSSAMGQAIVLGHRYNPQNGHTYVVTRQGSITTTNGYVSTLGIPLATINDSTEQAWIECNILPTFNALWIGLNDVATEGTFAWSSGQSAAYTNWGSGQPNNTAANDYAFMTSAGTWSMSTGTNTLTWGLLEYEPAPASVAFGPILNPANGSEYYLLTRGTWQQAQAAAINLGGHLVTIDNAQENEWIRNNFVLPFAIQVYIGITDQTIEGQFRWISGSTVTYTNWRSSEPSNGTGEDYGVMSYTGEWNDVAGTVAVDAVVEVKRCRADFNRDNASNTIDIFDFLNTWFAGCP